MNLPKYLYSANGGANSKIKTWEISFIEPNGKYVHYSNGYHQSVQLKIADYGRLDLKRSTLKLSKNEVIDVLITKLQKRIDYLEKQRTDE